MKYMLIVTSICLLCFVCPAQAQGLPGTEGLYPSPRGVSAGGPMLPGKSDSARWAFLKSHEETLIGLPKAKVISLFGPGGKGPCDNELVEVLDPTAVKGERVLVVDDLYQSGTTMNYVGKLLLDSGASCVYGLSCEKTCSNQD